MVTERIPNQVDKSLQTTRRFDALKLWMTAARDGRRRHRASSSTRCCDLAADEALEAARRRPAPRRGRRARPLLHPGLPPHPGGRHRPAEIDRANLYARKALFASGDAVVASTKVAGRHYLKFTLLNPETTAADIAAVLDLIAGHAEQYLGDSP